MRLRYKQAEYCAGQPPFVSHASSCTCLQKSPSCLPCGSNPGSPHEWNRRRVVRGSRIITIHARNDFNERAHVQTSARTALMFHFPRPESWQSLSVLSLKLDVFTTDLAFKLKIIEWMGCNLLLERRHCNSSHFSSSYFIGMAFWN